VYFTPAGSRPDRGLRPRPAHRGDPAARPRSRPARWLGAVALASGPALIAAAMIGPATPASAAASAPAASAAGGWSAQSVPSTGNNTLLTAVSARTGSDAWAVGEQFVAAGQAPAPPVAYHWSGSQWSLVPTPNLGVGASFSGVSASSATDAWAVGFSVLGHHEDSTLLEHWNGKAWSVDSAAAVTGYAAGLSSVVDLSPGNAWAVGRSAGTLLEHWNGTTWSQVALPDTAFTPGPGQSLSATSASDIWLVGTSVNLATDTTFAEALHYNGTSWSVVPMAQPGTNTPAIQAVTAISPTDAWAVGEDIGATSALGGSTLIEHWDGQKWSIVPSPTPGADPFLAGVAARGPDDVYAVGSNLPSINGGADEGLILRWNGSAWSVDADTANESLYGAGTVAGAGNEWAVGSGPLILSHS
jgi:hypothetical protein